MRDLRGYHVQGAGGSSGAGGGLLLLAGAYPGGVDLPALELEIPGFQNGKKCYIGYSTHDVWGVEHEPHLGDQIDVYYGPYYWGLGMVEIPPIEGWENLVTAYVDAAGTVVSGSPDVMTPARCYLLYGVVGDPAPNAAWYNTLPSEGYCPNYNQGYARKYMFKLKADGAQFLMGQARRGGSQYKLNGRYAATGGGGRQVDIARGLRQYSGSHSWATGWLYPGSSAYAYLQEQQDISPSVSGSPFSIYSRYGLSVTPDVQMYTSGITVPSIATETMTGSPATASTLSFRESDGRMRYYGCAIPDPVSIGGPFQLEGQFYGYEYPAGYSGMWLPSWMTGFIFTSEEITV